MAVKDWIIGFLGRHRVRFDPHDWPASDASEEMRVYALTWVTAFSLKQITEAEADEASRRIGSTPPNFRREHIPAVIQAVEQLRAETAPAAAAGGTRDAAHAASKGCPHCGGEGLALVWHRHPSVEQRIAPTASATCICAHGRWIRKVWADTDPLMLRRIPDLAAVLDGQGWYTIDDPSCVTWADEAPAGAERGEIP